MPQDAPMAKVEATPTTARETVLVGAVFDEALAEALEHARRDGATFVHAFEDEAVIAGQGTIGLELAEQLRTSRRSCCPSAAAGSPRGSRSRCARSGRTCGSSASQAGKARRPHDRRRDRRQAARQADDVDPRRPARRRRRRHRRGDQRRDRAAARAREARRRGRGRGRRWRRSSPARSTATGRSARSSPAATSTRRC